MPGPRIGFARVSDQSTPVATWSCTPVRLREAIRTCADIVDVTGPALDKPAESGRGG